MTREAMAEAQPNTDAPRELPTAKVKACPECMGDGTVFDLEEQAVERCPKCDGKGCVDGRTKWAVFVPAKGARPARHIAGSDGRGIAWTYERAEADEVARDHGGRVVDAEDFSKHWAEYRDGKR